jgi:hypothetical protein
MSWLLFGQRCDRFKRLSSFHFHPIRVKFDAMRLSPGANAPNGTA